MTNINNLTIEDTGIYILFIDVAIKRTNGDNDPNFINFRYNVELKTNNILIIRNVDFVSFKNDFRINFTTIAAINTAGQILNLNALIAKDNGFSAYFSNITAYKIGPLL